MDVVCLGVIVVEVDVVVCFVFVDVGLGEVFLYWMGYGIGVFVYEEFYIVLGNDLVFWEGMVFSIEFGIYFDGVWGVCIEDIVVVMVDGGECLNVVLYEFVLVGDC